MKLITNLTLLLFCAIAQAEQYTLSVCAIFQNEARYLDEWIDYHHEKGVEHFWLYNNNSTDNYQEILSPWIEAGIVELVQWPSLQDTNDWKHFSFTVQIGAYNHAITNARHTSKWLALIDTDEFIVPVGYKSIADFLENGYGHVSGLCVNWQCYGTSGVANATDGLLKNLVWKMKWDHVWNKHSKSIVQPLHVASCINPHHCFYTANHWAVDSAYRRTDICCQTVDISRIRLNHYWTRDEWFLWNVKVPRYQKWGGNIEDILKHANSMNEEYDPML